MFPNNGSGYIAGTKDFSRPAGKLSPYKRRGVEQLTDRELRGKLCGAHVNGCSRCECYDKCLVGMEWERRKNRAAVSADGRRDRDPVCGAGD